MAGPIGMKLGGMVKGMVQIVLAKEFFESVQVDQGQVGGRQVLLLGRGEDRDPELGMMGLLDWKWPMIRSANLRKVTRAR